MSDQNTYNDHNDWNDELKSISPFISSISRSNPFQIPGNYFEGLANNIYAIIYLDEDNTPDPDLFLDTKEDPFSLPDGYFEGLKDDINNKISLEEEEPDWKLELEQYAPSLLHVNRSNAFEVPPAYFMQVHSDISKNISDAGKTTKVRQMSLSRLANWLAAAAMLIGAILIWSISENEVGVTSDSIASLQEINDYMHLHSDDFYEALIYGKGGTLDFSGVENINMSEAFENISNSDIEDYILNDIDLELLQQELL